MALLLQHTEGAFHGAIWKVEESVNQFLAMFPPEGKQMYAQEIAVFSSDKRKLERLAVRALLYAMLGEIKCVAYEESGRPYLTDHSYHISISHTHGYVAVLLHPTHRVGIDIEQLSPRVQRIASRFLRTDEQPSTYEGDTIHSLLLHWSVKEAVYKCMSQPDPDFRKLRVEPFVVQPQGCFRVQELVTKNQHVYEAGYFLHADFVCTWVDEDPA